MVMVEMMIVGIMVMIMSAVKISIVMNMRKEMMIIVITCQRRKRSPTSLVLFYFICLICVLLCFWGCSLSEFSGWKLHVIRNFRKCLHPMSLLC